MTTKYFGMLEKVTPGFKKINLPFSTLCFVISFSESDKVTSVLISKFVTVRV